MNSGTITTVAGSGSCIYSGNIGDGGAATSASLNNPYGVAVDYAGNLYIADQGNCRVRKVNGGTITTVAGNGSCGYSGDGGAATSASLSHPPGVAVDGAGDLYIADNNPECRIRKVSGGTITTVAGNGFCMYGGDGGAAASASITDPRGIAVDVAGNLYIAATNEHRVRKVSLAARVASVGGIAEVPAIAAPRSHPGGWPPPVLLIVVGAAIVTTAVLAAGGCQVARRKRL
ncbi:MAG: hypothetical protein M1482_14960 [Chloroflexi bacterium]|nr:hypothetical protein [Chloroflexota bacterium]